MIYVTGDTHNLLNVDKIEDFIKNNKVSKNDYLIISGDFGCPSFGHEIPYDKAYYFWTEIPMQILFVDGNHENFFELNNLPIEEWNGGKIHRLAPNIIHLMRGQIYTIENKTFFTMGGATSPDKVQRILGFSYFEEEDCSYSETKEALDNLDKVNYSVDYIITHTIGNEFLKKNLSDIFSIYPEYSGNINNFLDYIEEIVDYKHWYFGHLHKDIEFEKTTLLYNKIIAIN